MTVNQQTVSQTSNLLTNAVDVAQIQHEVEGDA